LTYRKGKNGIQDKDNLVIITDNNIKQDIKSDYEKELVNSEIKMKFEDKDRNRVNNYDQMQTDEDKDDINKMRKELTDSSPNH